MCQGLCKQKKADKGTQEALRSPLGFLAFWGCLRKPPFLVGHMEQLGVPSTPPTSQVVSGRLCPPGPHLTQVLLQEGISPSHEIRHSPGRQTNRREHRRFCLKWMWIFPPLPGNGVL